ncbi:MAG: glycosyltransferase [Candidatus Melainabacteria bacterium]|nr:glycosyltransferase [Candidatus Melainabacteria bacterium]
MPVKASICLPVHNGERFLSPAIESVLNQTESNFELIISDDCSTDCSPEIIADYARRDKRIKLLNNQRRLGLFANYNRCMKESSSNYLKLFAQDDLLDKEALEKSLSVLEEKQNVTLVSVARRWIDENGIDVSDRVNEIRTSTVIAPNGTVAGWQVVEKSLLPPVNFIGEPSTVIIRKSSMGAGFDESFLQMGDLEYWLRILMEGDFVHLDETLCSFRLHPQSSSSANLKGLHFASDLIRLSRKWRTLFRIFNLSETQFLNQAVQETCAYLRSLTESELPTLEGLRSKDNLIAAMSRLQASGKEEIETILIDELLCFRELAFHCLRQLSSEESRSGSVHSSRFGNNQIQKEIAFLERLLRSMLESPSWKVTRFLRESKRILFSGAADGELFDVDCISCTDSREQESLRQKAYLRYLNDRIAKVEKSRSWFLTQPLRWKANSSKQEKPKAPPESTGRSQKLANQAQQSPSISEQSSSTPRLQSTRSTAKSGDYRYELAIATMFKNEAKYLREWIEFHKLLGVEHFYLFNNQSTDDFLCVLAPYVKDGVADLLEWPGHCQDHKEFQTLQRSCFERAVAIAAGRAKWLALIDTDEFIVPVSEDNLPAFLNRYEEFGGLCINWQGFGSSHLDRLPDKSLLIESLQRCAALDHPYNLHVKTIVRPEQVERISNVHYPDLIAGSCKVNAEGIPIEGVFSPYVSFEKIRLNHYWSRDKEHLYSLKIPKTRGVGRRMDDEMVALRERDFNFRESDGAIARFAAPLRARLGFAENASPYDCTTACKRLPEESAVPGVRSVGGDE